MTNPEYERGFADGVQATDGVIEDIADANGGYWGEHPHYPINDWKYEVNNDDTRRGYWEWVEACIALDDE